MVNLGEGNPSCHSSRSSLSALFVDLHKARVKLQFDEIFRVSRIRKKFEKYSIVYLFMILKKFAAKMHLL